MRIKKRTLLIAGILLSGLVGILSGAWRFPFTRPESPLKTVARADVGGCSYTCDYSAGWTEQDCQCLYCGINCRGGDGACGDCCGGGCFPAGTSVSTPTGVKAIETFMPGDEIRAFDPETGAVMVSRVVKTLKHSWDEVGTTSPLLIVTHEKGQVTLTANHPVYKRGSQNGEYRHFAKAETLQVGDKLTLEDGGESAITRIDKGPEYDFVYNLEVENVHTYFADNVRVHNKADTGCSGDGTGDGTGDGSCGGSDSGCGCFPTGTPISTSTGVKAIETFVPGDEIKAFDPETGAIVASRVVKTLKHSWDEVNATSPLLIVTHEQGQVTLTVNHYVYKHGSESEKYRHFAKAETLQVGDWLTLENGEESAITHIEKGPKYDFVYNLEVENVHTYFADNVRVHNGK